MSFRLKVLGGLAILRDGAPAAGDVTHRSRLALLALLSRGGPGGVSRDKLLALLWPESEADRAQGALRQALFVLRRDLGKDVVAGGAELYLNPEAISTDVADFERALGEGRNEEAVQAYGGPFLDGFFLRASAEFDEWVEAERQRLAARLQGALERLAERAEAEGRPALASEWWGRLAAEDPLSSRIALRLMQSLAAAGDRPAALRHARVYGHLVQARLGCPPDVKIQELISRLEEEGATESTRTASTSEPMAPSAMARSLPPRPVAGSDSPPSSEDLSDETPEARSSRSAALRRRRRTAGALAALVTVTGMGTLVWNAWERRSTDGVDPMRVAVLPFENRSTSPALDGVGSTVAEWIADGVTEKRQGDPVVLAGGRPSGDEGSSGPETSRLARRAGAGALVRGAYWTQNDTLVLQAWVENLAATSGTRAVRPVSVPLGALSEAAFPLRDAVLGALALFRDARYAGLLEGIAAIPTFSAYEEFMAGMDAFAGGGEGGEGLAGERFRRAFSRDSLATVALEWLIWTGGGGAEGRAAALRTWNDAWEHLSAVERTRLEYFLLPDTALEPTRLRLARRAAEIAPRSAWSFATGRHLFRMDRPGEALEYFAMLDPARDWVRLWMTFWDIQGSAFEAVGDHEGALRRLGEARRLDSLNILLASREALELAHLGRTEELERLSRQARTMPPGSYGGRAHDAGSVLSQACWGSRDARLASATQRWCREALRWMDEHPRPEAGADRFWVLYALGRWDEAQSVADAALASGPARPGSVADVARVAARRGDEARLDKAMSALDDLFASGSRGQRSTIMVTRAEVAALRGDRDGAVRLVEETFALGLSWPFFAWRSWDFDNLRGFAPFEALRASRVSAPAGTKPPQD